MLAYHYFDAFLCWFKVEPRRSILRFHYKFVSKYAQTCPRLKLMFDEITANDQLCSKAWIP